MSNITHEIYQRMIAHGCTPVEYIENTGDNAYIDTGVQAVNIKSVYVEYQATEIPSGRISAVFGALRTSSDGNFCMFFRSNNSASQYVRYGTGSYTIAPSDLNRNSVFMDDADLYFNGQKVHTFTDSKGTCRHNIYLFCTNYATTGVSNRGFVGKIFTARIYDSNDDLVKDFYPCINGNNVAGMYDAIGDTFYPSANSDTFSSGEIVPDDDAESEITESKGLPIMRGGQPFNNLVLHKFTYESIVMSLGDKISGDAYYRDNSLVVDMQEYVTYNGVDYVLVNPPTIVREGLVADNSELKGMTKYSFVFYHPMYMLGNFPFTDIAVGGHGNGYLSQDKTFYWIGNLTDMVAKLNANLESTQWLVALNLTTEAERQKAAVLSDVLSFDKQFISDVLKTSFDTWDIPFTIVKLEDTDERYAAGKRFAIVFGNPSEQVYEVDEYGERTSVPYIFRFGQGVGLKNNSRNPRDNKIVTRISGCGSERNIPYGYPQIVWYGDQHATVTQDGYQIYDGVVGGQPVKLIKHPFTRKTLMPSVYTHGVFNKVSPYLSGGSANPDYDPTIKLVDYYDATGGTYANPINPSAPSVEIHQFEKVYPRLLGTDQIVDAVPYQTKTVNGKVVPVMLRSAFYTRLQGDMATAKNMNERSALGRLQTALLSNVDKYEDSNVGGSYTFDCGFLRTGTGVHHVEYQSDNVSYDYCVVDSLSSAVWDDSVDDEGNYNQPYFKITLPVLAFDIYACASATEKMQINMRSGACIGCTFDVQVDWDDYKRNFYKPDGTFDPVEHTTDGDGHVRDATKYPDSSQTQVTLIVQKDTETFGTLMPNTFQQPSSGDNFVILGISLPQSYVSAAETELDSAMQQYMLENNVYYYDYPLKFDEFFLTTNKGILEQIKNNCEIKFKFANTTMVLFVKQISIKYGEKALPQYDITLADDIEIVLNRIGQVTDDVSRMRVELSELQKYYSGDLADIVNDKLSRIVDDVAQGRIRFQQGLDSIGKALFSDILSSPDFEAGLYDGKGWRIDQLGNAEFESLRVRSYLEIVELLVNRMQAQEGDTLFTDNDQIDKVERVTVGGVTTYILSLKEKYDGYITPQQEGNIIKGIINTLAAKQAGVSDEESSSVEIDGQNKYYVSWMNVVETHNTTGSTLGVNQIRVSLYGDDYYDDGHEGEPEYLHHITPAGKNFPPCELMKIARWGCNQDPDEVGITDGEKQSRIRRQRLFQISVTDGRVTKYEKVNSPILRDDCYGVTIGELPEFVKNYTDVRSVLNVVGEHTDWMYAQGVVVGNFIKIDRVGHPVINYVDRGNWQNNTEYLCNEYNQNSLQYETHDVWHNGSKWRCKRHQPVVSGGITTYYEPTDSDTTNWEKITTVASGTDGIVVSLDNNMDSISCDNNGYPQAVQTVRTTATMYFGSSRSASSLSIYDTNTSGYQYQSGTAHDGITVTWSDSDGVITVSFATGVQQPEKKLFYIQLVGVATRFITFTVLCERGVPLYKLIPSSTTVVKHNDNTYTPSSNITCSVTKLVNGVSSTPSASEYTIKTYVDGTEVVSSTVAPSSVSSNVVYELWKGSKMVDTQTISLLVDGQDGTSSFLLDFDNEMDSVACGSSTHPVIAQSVSTTLTLWKGSEQRDFYITGITRNGQSSMGTGVTVSPSVPMQSSNADDEITLTISYDTTATIDKKDDFEIVVTDKLDSSISKSLHFTVNGIAGNTVYNLQPSDSQIKIPKGSSQTKANLTCGYTKNELGTVTTVNDVTGTIDGEYRLFFRRHAIGGSYELTAYEYVTYKEYICANSSNVGGLDLTLYDGVKFYLYKNTSSSTTTSLIDPTKVIDMENVPVVSDGIDGNDGADAIIWTIDTNIGSIRIPQGASSAPQTTVTANFYKKVGDNARVATTEYYGIYRRTGNVYTYLNGGNDDDVVFYVTAQDTYDAYVIFLFDSSYSGSNPLSQTILTSKEIIVIPSGASGQRGLTGRFYYYAGEWDETNNTDTFKANDYQVPYWHVASSNNYWLYIGENWNSDKTMYQINADYGAPSSSSDDWKIMYNDFEYIITKAVFGEFAKFGSSIISGDWMISTNGTINGMAYNNGAMYNSAPAYTWFDPAYPNESVNTTHTVNGTTWTGYNFVPNYAIDLLTGASYQNDAYIRGKIYAKTLTRSLKKVYVEVPDWANPDWSYNSLVTACGGELPSILVLQNIDSRQTIAGTSTDYYISVVNVCLPPADEWEGHQMTIYCQKKIRSHSGNVYYYYPRFRIKPVDSGGSDVGFQNVLFSKSDRSIGYAEDSDGWTELGNESYSTFSLTIVSAYDEDKDHWRWVILERSIDCGLESLI